MICERITMSTPPFGSASPSFGPKASKAQKPRMLILLAICIHDNALCIQLANVQISFTELKSFLNSSPRFASGELESQNDKNPKPIWVNLLQSPRFASGKLESQMIKTPSGQISRTPSLRVG
jgi:hypothetical protein